MGNYPASVRMLRSMLKLKGYATESIDVQTDRAHIVYCGPDGRGFVEGTPAEIAAQIKALPDHYDMKNFRRDLREMAAGRDGGVPREG